MFGWLKALYHFSSYVLVSGGVPQGGVLSPIPWLLHFNVGHTHPRSLRAEEPEAFGHVGVADLFFSGDVTNVVSHGHSVVLVRVADVFSPSGPSDRNWVVAIDCSSTCDSYSVGQHPCVNLFKNNVTSKCTCKQSNGPSKTTFRSRLLGFGASYTKSHFHAI